MSYIRNYSNTSRGAMTKKKVPSGYLSVIHKCFNPDKDLIKYVRGDYVLKNETKQQLVREVGSDAFVLYDYFYDKRNAGTFAPTKNELIGEALGWSVSKVARVKTTLVKNDLLYISKETTREGTTIYKTVLHREVVKYIKEHNRIPDDVDFELTDMPKDKQ
jgi:hypothetical protein